MGHDSLASVLREAQTTLETAELGLEDFLQGNRPARRIAGLRNAIVFGRAVTNVLQNIKTFERDNFDQWYAPHQREMRENVDFKYLVELRNQVLKEGVLGSTSGSLMIDYFDSSQLKQLRRPAGGKAFFMGDRLGGSGWEVELADGSTETYYVDLPTSWQVKAGSHFVDVTTQLGLEPPKTPIDQLLTNYLNYLSRLVAEARRMFGGEKGGDRLTPEEPV